MARTDDRLSLLLRTSGIGVWNRDSRREHRGGGGGIALHFSAFRRASSNSLDAFSDGRPCRMIRRSVREDSADSRPGQGNYNGEFRVICPAAKFK